MDLLPKGRKFSAGLLCFHYEKNFSYFFLPFSAPRKKVFGFGLRKKKIFGFDPRKKKFFFEVQKKAEKNKKIFFHNENIKDGQKIFCL